MFETLYKSVDLQVHPSLDLINETKAKMKQESNNSNKVIHMNFYKYGTIAACFIIFIGVLTLKTQNNIMMDVDQSVNETVQDSYKETTGNNFGGNPFNSAFDSAMSSDSASINSMGAKNSFLENIVEFFANIIQWFKELLF